MKMNDIIWFAIMGLWMYATFFTDYQWLGFIVVPLIVGIFIISSSRQQVDDENAFYIKMSKKIPF